MGKFKIISDYRPTGDQPNAIDRLSKSILAGERDNILLGVTGSGKTFTVANIIEKVQKPTLVLAHNKILASQLASEFKTFFPENAVEFFVSYYDYYQPEAYIASSDTYIEKDSKINDELDKLRHSATSALFEREDVIIVSSVSCIYGLGNPIDYKNMTLSLRQGYIKSRDEIIDRLVDMQYQRNDINFIRNTFRVRGDIIEILPAYEYDRAYRIELFGDEIDRIIEINVLTGDFLSYRNHLTVYPASHYVTPKDKLELAIAEIERELEERVKFFRDNNLLVEAQRISQRTRYDIEMLREVGTCTGVENYSRVMSLRPTGARPYTLIDYFPKDFLLVVDESHQTLPQVRAMYGGDRSRKLSLVDHGFRLPSALDNRPLNFEEFENLTPSRLYVSATPGAYELEHQKNPVEQLIRPTGLLDPIIEVRPSQNQMDDLYEEIQKRIAKSQRVLITTITKKMAEDLTAFFKKMDVKAKYLHSDIKTIERMQIIRSLRLGEFDVLIGVNLLREGLDIPEVSLVAILDADKKGLYRSETALIQTIGRAARNSEGMVLLYADEISSSMQVAIDETTRRRKIQEKYNKDHNIIPKTIIKPVHEIIEISQEIDEISALNVDKLNKKETEKLIAKLEEEMFIASAALQYERAAMLRDMISELKEGQGSEKPNIRKRSKRTQS